MGEALRLDGAMQGATQRQVSTPSLPQPRALAALPDQVGEALRLDGAMKELAAQLKEAQDLIFFGRGYNYSTALEAALKVGVKARCCVDFLMEATNAALPAIITMLHKDYSHSHI